MVKSWFDAHIPLFCSSLQHSQLRMQFLTDVHAAINSPLFMHYFYPIFCLFTSMNYRLIQTANSRWGCCEWSTGDREAWLSAISQLLPVTQPIFSASSHLFAVSIIKTYACTTIHPCVHAHTHGQQQGPVRVFLELRQINYKCGAHVFFSVVMKGNRPG